MFALHNHLGTFAKSQRGNIAVMMAILMLPLLVGMGVALDYGRYASARSHLQDLTDGVSLALAASREKDQDKLRAMAQAHVAAHSASGLKGVQIANLIAENDQVDIALKGTLKTTFMGLVNINSLDVETSALSLRAVTGSVEVALVLDNTWSMSETDAHGMSKIATLKTAAASLTSELMTNPDAMVRIGLVPYADYVNVGTQHRGAPWLAIPADYTIEPEPKTCETLTTKNVCVQKDPTYPCTKVIDGVSEPATCGGGCTKYETREVEPYQSCQGGGSAKKYTWHGCVGSRMSGTTRLDDGSPSVTYPGYVETSQKCLNPIVPLSTDKEALLAAINGMIINVGSYKPYTYIPAGLIWGQNLLSPTEPFGQGADYDPNNVSPRKVVVLMTDGENTLRFNSSNGRHSALSSNPATGKTQITKTNQDTAAICDYMKSNKIEIFTVAFMVTDTDAKSLLEGCASDAEHYYDASNPEKLMAAFAGIAQSLSKVRLAR